MSELQIKKRDGTVVKFEKDKIVNAIFKAARSVGGKDKRIAEELADKVVESLRKHGRTLPNVEEVQDAVEKVLIEDGHAKTAKAYILYRQKRADIRQEKMLILEKDDVDEVDKRFDTNALRVLKARYLRKDDNGKLIETPKQLFTRVAIHAALPDMLYDKRVHSKDGGEPEHEYEYFDNTSYANKITIGKYALNMYHLEAVKRMYDMFNKEGKMKVHWSKFLEMMLTKEFDSYEKSIDDFYNLMKHKKFMPNTPAIANFGSVLGMGSACFHPNQLVITENGPKMISEINEGEYVLTHKNRFKKVTEVFKRTSDEMFEINCQKLPNTTLLATAEHPILCHENGKTVWKPVSELSKGSMVATSYLSEIEDVDKISVGKINNVPVEDGVCIYSYKGGKFDAFVHKTKPVKNIINVDYDLMLVFGYYLAEGNVTDNDCLRFTFSQDEKEICKDVISIIKDKFGVDARIEETNRPDRKWLSLRFHSTILAKFFKNIFGSGFDKKTIPSWILRLPVEKQRGMIIGMLKGDGTIFKNYKQYNARVVMCNTNLIYTFWQMCMRAGIFTSLKIEPMPKLGTKNPVSCTIGTDGYDIINQASGNQIQQMLISKKQYINVDGVFFTPVTEINKIKYTGNVYNLEVEDDHSYVANMVSVHNCFVVNIEDSIDDIMEKLKQTAIVFKAGGGMGYNFSKLRPEGDFVRSTCGIASGPITFMKLFDTMTEVIKQGGIRRGANMGIMNINHPDIEKFITAKDGNKALRNFNISVLVMGDFWKYYESGEPYPLMNPKDGKVTKHADPRKLFDKIVYQAWESAEPGVLFYDNINKYNPFLKHLGPIVTTNPCVAADTKILTENGWIEIEKLANMEEQPKLLVDARTLSYSSGQRQMQAGLLAVKAEKIWKTGEKETLILRTESGKELTATPDHRILTRRGWTPASNIRIGEEVFVQNGDGEPLQEHVCSIKNWKTIPVYDITEPQTHSFIANGIVVHNCGEVLLYGNESCNLGSINVWAFVDEDGQIDWEGMKHAVMSAAKFLDNVMDVNKFPLKQIADMTRSTRKTGLGIMGVGDLLYELGIPYNTAEGRAFMERIFEFINYWSKVESVELAKERGSLPYYDKSFYPEGKMPFAGFYDKDSWHFDWDSLAEAAVRDGIRNGFTTVIAPTGSISMIAGCSSGIEPVYSLAFEKNVKVGSFFYVDPAFEKSMQKEGLLDNQLMEDIAENSGSLQKIPYLPQSIKRVFVTANDITPEDHIMALAAFQKWTDSSISKTNNFPADATVEHMRESYMLAHKLGCKGVTVFRDSSIKDQVLVSVKKEKQVAAPVSKEESKITAETNGERNVIATVIEPFLEKKSLGERNDIRTVIEAGDYLQTSTNGMSTVPAGDNIRTIPLGEAESFTSPTTIEGADLSKFEPTATRISFDDLPHSKAEIKSCPSCDSSTVLKEGCVSCTECGWGLCS